MSSACCRVFDAGVVSRRSCDRLSRKEFSAPVFGGCDSFLLVSWQKPGMDVADGYVTFVRHSQDMLREKINEEVYTERLFEVSRFL